MQQISISQVVEGQGQLIRLFKKTINRLDEEPKPLLPWKKNVGSCAVQMKRL